MVAKRKPKAKAKGKKGGKGGNQNARKHGLYAKNQPPVDPAVAIGAQRREAILDKIILDLDALYWTLKKNEEKFQCVNSISNAVTSANGCQRTAALVSGKLTILNEAIERLLNEDDPYDASTTVG
jgi:hypothetical protein